MRKITSAIMGTALSILLALGTIDSTSYAAESTSTTSVSKQEDYICYKDDKRHSMVAYDFSESRNYGATRDGSLIDFEGLVGIRLSSSGKNVFCEVYSNVSKFTKAEVTLYKRDVLDKKLAKEYGTVFKDKSVSYTFTKEDIPGVYSFYAVFDEDGVVFEVIGSIYYDGNKALTCRYMSKSEEFFNDEKEAWEALMSDADPDDYLSNANTTYPTSGVEGRPVHVEEWEDYSDSLVFYEDWTDEAKLYNFVDHLTKEFAYDNYRYDKLNMVSRANNAGVYADEYYMYYNHVGVCWDFVNALAIMCRHNDIPATSVESSGHTALAVWLNGEWVCIDPTELIMYSCKTEATKESNWITKSDRHSYADNYGVYTDIFETHDTQIWSPESIKKCKELGTTK
jgi:hypothetical protein